MQTSYRTKLSFHFSGDFGGRLINKRRQLLLNAKHLQSRFVGPIWNKLNQRIVSVEAQMLARAELGEGLSTDDCWLMLIDASGVASRSHSE